MVPTHGEEFEGRGTKKKEGLQRRYMSILPTLPPHRLDGLLRQKRREIRSASVFFLGLVPA